MEKNELNYIVKLIRVDGSTVDLVETKEFNRAKEIWKESYTQWSESVAERRPFVVEEPCDTGFITAFDPSLIREILILPISLEEKSPNPYKNRMRTQGLAATMQGGDLMDGGYT